MHILLKINWVARGRVWQSACSCLCAPGKQNDGEPSKETRIMMKILMKTTLLVSLLAIGLGTTFATTTDQLELSVSGLTATFVDNVVGCTGTGCSGLSGDLNSAAGELVVLGTIGGWDISVTTGKSYSPNDIPVGLDLASLTATCAAGAACDNETLSI